MSNYFQKETDSISDSQDRPIGAIPVAAVPDPDKRPLIVPPPMETREAPYPAGNTSTVATARSIDEGRVALFVPTEANDLRARWDSIQVGFVDQPRNAVQDADALVSLTMKRLADAFAAEREKLEHQWDKNENISTEDLRITLQRYRSFFGRLLSI
jgi:hypothetical protein